MAFHHTPPPVFVGGAQPYAPRRLSPSETAVPVNEPPGIIRSLLMVATLAAWQAVPVAAQPARVVPPPAAEAAPVFSRAWLSSVVDSWHQAVWVQPAQRRLSPSELAVSEDLPTPRSLDWLSIVADIWQPGPPCPITARRSVIAIPAAAEDVPIPSAKDWLAAVVDVWYKTEPQAPILRNLPAALKAVPEDSPIPGDRRAWLPTVCNAWLLDPLVPPITARHVPQAEAGVAAEQPAFTRTWLSLGAWQLQVPHQVVRRFVPPEPVAAPLSRGGWLSAVLAWNVDAGMPQRPARLPASVLAVPEDEPTPFSRAWLPSLLGRWQPGPPSPPITIRYLPAFALAVLEDQPISRDYRHWLPAVLRSWQPEPAPVVKQLQSASAASAAAVGELVGVIATQPALSGEIRTQAALGGKIALH